MSGDHAREMFLGNVRNFMRHHAGKFRFALRCENKSAIKAHKAAGQCECINGGVLQSKKLEFLVRVSLIRSQNQLVAQIGKVARDFRIVHIAAVGANFRHDLKAELSFLAG